MSGIDSTAVTQCHPTTTVLRTRSYRVCPTPDFVERLTECRHAQRAVYNLTVAALPREGGQIPPAMSSPAHPDGLNAQLTRWRAATPWLAEIPTALARPAVAQARGALHMHEGALEARAGRLLGEDATWTRWSAEHPDFDPGAWDALEADDKRAAVKAGEAPPKSASTWRDERAGAGSRQGLFRHRKTASKCAVTWLTPPRRVSADTLRLPGLGEIKVIANNGLPEASRLKAARVCVKRGTRKRQRFEVHLAVRVDIVPRTKRKRMTPRVAGADMGCADTLTLHNGHTLTLPDHGVGLDAALSAQRAMSKCVVGSRRWKSDLARVQAAKHTMGCRDRDAVRKTAKTLATTFDMLGLESLNIAGMGTSARGRSWSGVGAKRALNRRIRAALWGFTQCALGAALEARGGEVLKLPAMDSSRTCGQCGHVDGASRNARKFECTGCRHRANADVNAGRNLRARALRYLEIKGDELTDSETHQALWKELRTARKRPEAERAGDAEASTKPARSAAGAHHNGGAGAPSTTLAEEPPTRGGEHRSRDAGAEGGQEERLSV